jgi:hypothetical protein
VPPVIRRLEDGTQEFSEIRRGFPPVRPKRPPVIQLSVRGATLSGSEIRYRLYLTIDVRGNGGPRRLRSASMANMS